MDAEGGMMGYWDTLTDQEKVRWRHIYSEMIANGYPDKTAHREAYIRVWREREA
jgi:hypothetical protein